MSDRLLTIVVDNFFLHAEILLFVDGLVESEDVSKVRKLLLSVDHLFDLGVNFGYSACLDLDPLVCFSLQAGVQLLKLGNFSKDGHVALLVPVGIYVDRNIGDCCKDCS